MSAQNKRAARAAVELKRGRDLHKEVYEGTKWEGEDPYADTRVTDKGTYLLVTYDGAGYDLLSCEGDFGAGQQAQDRINATLAETDPNLYIENNNSWSFGIWYK